MTPAHEPTPEQYRRLREIRRAMGLVAGPTGPLHSFWEDMSAIDFVTGQGTEGQDPGPIDQFIVYLEARLDSAK